MDEDPDMAIHYIEQRIVSLIACQHSCHLFAIYYKLVSFLCSIYSCQDLQERESQKKKEELARKRMDELTKENETLKKAKEQPILSDEGLKKLQEENDRLNAAKQKVKDDMQAEIDRLKRKLDSERAKRKGGKDGKDGGDEDDDKGGGAEALREEIKELKETISQMSSQVADEVEKRIGASQRVSISILYKLVPAT